MPAAVADESGLSTPGGFPGLIRVPRDLLVSVTPEQLRSMPLKDLASFAYQVGINTNEIAEEKKALISHMLKMVVEE